MIRNGQNPLSYVTVLLFFLSSRPTNALALPPQAFHLVPRESRTTRNNVVAALVSILVIIILTAWGIWRLVSVARRAINGTVTGSSTSSGSGPRGGLVGPKSGSSESYIATWQATSRFFRGWVPGAGQAPRPRVRNVRGVQVDVQDVYPAGPPPGFGRPPMPPGFGRPPGFGGPPPPPPPPG